MRIIQIPFINIHLDRDVLILTRVERSRNTICINWYKLEQKFLKMFVTLIETKFKRRFFIPRRTRMSQTKSEPMGICQKHSFF